MSCKLVSCSPVVVRGLFTVCSLVVGQRAGAGREDIGQPISAGNGCACGCSAGNGIAQKAATAEELRCSSPEK